ncbi:MAG: hypothetical protein ACI9HK_001505 [Pirellulaceae bacterium]|jgi:hypothetical protein
MSYQRCRVLVASRIPATRQPLGLKLRHGQTAVLDFAVAKVKENPKFF